jgi:hypothetical protein
MHLNNHQRRCKCFAEKIIMKKRKIIVTSRENENKKIAYFLQTFVTRRVLALASSSKTEWGPTKKQNFR